MPGQSGSNKLPVFTTPQQEIRFYADDPISFKQILTIYNPYEFLVKFRISCTDCSKYTVSAAQGTIKPNHSIDIVVHHKAAIPSNIGVSDTVRIQLYTSGQSRSGGKKDIQITLLSSAQREKVHPLSLDTDRFQQLETDSAALGHLRQQPLAHERNNSGLAAFYIIAISVCILLLNLPNIGDECNWPEYIPRLTSYFKLWTAFATGVFSALFMKT